MSSPAPNDDSTIEPFGVADGALAELDGLEDSFVHPPEYFGGIARTANDARVRVVVGRLGAGKSLYLRRMHRAQLDNASVFAEDTHGSPFIERPARNLSDLQSADIVQFMERMDVDTDNTELWKRLWRAAIFRAAASYVICEPAFRRRLPDRVINKLAGYQPLLGAPREKRRITHEARLIIQTHDEKPAMTQYLADPGWSDAEQAINEALRDSRPLFLYVDAIDDNFKYAPAHWMRCQRGLFYAVMDLIRETEESNRLHVVIALRDIALASTRTSEAGSRYLEETHINILSWNSASIRYLLEEKIGRLPGEYLLGRTRSVSGWLGTEDIANPRRNGNREPIADYLIRHTRLVPRDVVILGNRLSRMALQAAATGMSADRREAELRRTVARASREFVQNQLAQVANQVWSEAMPADASRHDFEHVYIAPSQHQISYAVDAVLDCVASTGTEVFERDALLRMDDLMQGQLETNASLSNILWQNQLLGVAPNGDLATAEAGIYYSLDDYSRVTLPGADRYVWNPLMFDAVESLTPTLARPLPPT